MATAINRRATLTGSQKSYTTIEGDHAAVQVTNVSGTAEVFYMIGDTEASIADADVVADGLHPDLYSLPASVGANRVHVRRLKEPRTVVKMVSAGTPKIEVQGLDRQVNL